MAKVVLDASAILALLQKEPGHELVRASLRSEDCMITTANLAEVAAKLQQALQVMAKVRKLLDVPNLTVRPVTEEDAYKAAELIVPGRPMGLSLGDRLCLAAGILEGAVVLTTDQAWARLGKEGPTVRLAR